MKPCISLSFSWTRNCAFLCYSLRLRLTQKYISIHLYIV